MIARGIQIGRQIKARIQRIIPKALRGSLDFEGVILRECQAKSGREPL